MIRSTSDKNIVFCSKNESMIFLNNVVEVYVSDAKVVFVLGNGNQITWDYTDGKEALSILESIFESKG